jgi:hypothetical protein
MDEFLANMIKALEFALRETSPQDMLRILTERIRHIFETSTLERDIDNFLAYFRVIISGKRSHMMPRFNRKLVQAFIERTDTGLGNAAADFRTEKLYKYLHGKISDGTEITAEHFEEMHAEYEAMKVPSFEKLMENIRIAMILKWVQGPLMRHFSHALQDYIVVLATVYGESKKSVFMNVEWPTLCLPDEDKYTLEEEYRLFEIAMMEALQALRSAYAAKSVYINTEEQFGIVFNSLDQLANMDEAGTLNSIDSFKDRIIVSAALIYLQDDYVKKDAKLRQLIRLFVSLYFKYRDKHYTSVNH